MVVITVWSVKENKTFYSIPSHVYTEWFLSRTSAKTIAVSFDKLLTETSISRIVWSARINNFNRMILGVMSSEIEDVDFEDAINQTLDGVTLGSQKERQAETVAIATSFLDIIGLVETNPKGVRLSEACLHRLEDMFKELGSAAERFTKVDSKESATMLILFHMFRSAFGAGIPGPLLEKAGDVLAMMMHYIIEDGSDERFGKCSVCGRPLPSTRPTSK